MKGEHKQLRIVEIKAAIVVLSDDAGKTYKIGRKQIHSLLDKEVEESRARVWDKS